MKKESRREAKSLNIFRVSKRGVSPSFQKPFPSPRVERGTQGVRLINNISLLLVP
jgi:hypothetical protein